MDNKSYNIAAAPLYFVRSGYVNRNIGRLGGAGNDGFDWSARSHPRATDAYNLDFYASVVNPSGYYYLIRWYGFPIRCLAR